MKNKVGAAVKQMIAALSSIAKSKTLALKSKTRAIKTRIIIFSLLRNKKFVMSSISHKLHALLGHQQYQKQYYASESESDSIHEEDDHQDQSKGRGAPVVYSNIDVMSHLHSHEPSNINPTEHYLRDPQDDIRDGHHHGAAPHDVDIDRYHDDDGHIDHQGHVDVVIDNAENYLDLSHSLFDSEDQFKSVIDIVKNSKQESGQKFSLEDEIDHVADLFIRRFHRQIRIQKQHSLKRHQLREQQMLIHSGA